MSLIKKIKDVFSKKEEKPVPKYRPIPAPPARIPTKSTVPSQKPAGTKAVQKTAAAKKPAQKKNPGKKQQPENKMNEMAYSEMHAEYSKVKKLITQGDMATALPKVRNVVSLCLDMELARHKQKPQGNTLQEKLETLVKTDSLPESTRQGYQAMVKRISPENEAAFIKQKEKGEKIIQALGTIINYEKGEIFKKGPKKKQVKKPQPKKQNEKKADTLSFRARETRGVQRPQRLDTEEILQKLKMAADFIEKRNADDSLVNTRRALEIMANRLCEKYNILQEGLTLENKIDALRSPVPLAQGQANTFHKARQLSNRGTHYSDRPATLSEAQQAFTLTKQVLEMYTMLMRRNKTGTANVPLRNPDYYSQNRKYYGRWYTCNTRQALSMNSDFMKLQAEAEHGNVQAMLDIAIGFLPTNILWSEVSLIKHPDNSRFRDPYDARYYYWITRACDTAYNDWKAGKDLPLPYLATALLEGLKFYVYYEYHRRHPGRDTAAQDNQYAQVTQYMFGKFMGSQEKFADMLLAMMREYAPENLICTAHDERTEEYVKFLMYLTKIKWGEKRVYNRSARRYVNLYCDLSEPVQEKYAIRKEDVGLPASKAIEKYHDFVYDVHHAYCGAIQKRSQEAHQRTNGR